MMRVKVGDRVRIIKTGQEGVVTWRSRELTLSESTDGASLEIDVGQGGGPRNAATAREAGVEVLDGAS